MERFLQEDKRALRERVHLEKRAIEEFHLQTVNRCLWVLKVSLLILKVCRICYNSPRKMCDWREHNSPQGHIKKKKKMGGVIMYIWRETGSCFSFTGTQVLMLHPPNCQSFIWVWIPERLQGINVHSPSDSTCSFLYSWCSQLMVCKSHQSSSVRKEKKKKRISAKVKEHSGCFNMST